MSITSTLRRGSLALTAAAFCFTTATAQSAPLSTVDHRLDIRSGVVQNDQADPAAQGLPAVVWSRHITVPGAAWMRLHYEGVLLSGQEAQGNGAFLRMTAVRDQGLMTQHTSHVSQWQNTSAYFNGDTVLMEILAYPGTGPCEIHIAKATYAPLPPRTPRTICGPTDDRQLSSDPRAGRLLPVGCTAWLIDDCNKCFLTAGHCTGNIQVVQFNVPLSTGSGGLQNPPPSDQYSVDPASLQTNGGQGIGNDYAHFGTFPNSTTGMTAAQAQGQTYILASSPPTVSGQNIRITGYGTTSSPVSPTWNQVQKTHLGPYFSFAGSTIRYTTDTTGGNSGSPVIDESTGMAIGIHTHGGCDPANHGTGSNNSGLQAFLANPQGVCFCPGLTFTLPNGVPDIVAPGGGTTVRVQVGAAGGNTPQAGTGRMFVSLNGGAFQNLPMSQVSANVYDAVFPSATCGDDLRFYFQANDTTGASHTEPSNAPSQTFNAIAALGINTIVAYDFNTAPVGWTVTNTALATGAWARAVPAGNNGSRQDPASDFDGSGQCWVTGNGFNEDVDGGPTTLTTEQFDLSASTDPTVRYARWFQTNGPRDMFVAQISENGGTTWTTIESVGNTQNWTEVSFSVRSLATNLSQIRFRFSVADNPNTYSTEGGLDAFEIFDVGCNPAASWTAFGSGCAGSNGTPDLQLVSLPSLGSTFSIRMDNLPNGGVSYMGFGFSNTVFNGMALPASLAPSGLPGCTLLASLDAGTLLINLGTSATWSLTLPNDPSLAGITFYNQGFSFDPAVARPVRAAVSNAGQAVVN